jgi:hypothetical protein
MTGNVDPLTTSNSNLGSESKAKDELSSAPRLEPASGLKSPSNQPKHTETQSSPPNTSARPASASSWWWFQSRPGTSADAAQAASSVGERRSIPRAPVDVGAIVLARPQSFMEWPAPPSGVVRSPVVQEEEWV